MKKLVSPLLFISVAFSSLSACGGASSTTPAPQTPVPPPVGTVPPVSTPPVSTASQSDDFIRREIAAQNIPALSALIFKEDVVLHSSNFGTSNIERNIALEADHLFLLASVSKVVTATALLQLHQDGLFSLDDKINDFLGFSVNVPGQTTDITFRMLLTHTSGIADGPALDDQYYYGVDSPIALDDYLRDYLVPGGRFYDAEENFYGFEPGTEYEYSNTGTALIGLLVQKISGIDFAEYCHRNIFEPLGMTNSYWRLSPITGTIVQPYEFENGAQTPIEHYTFTDYPNGGLRSTAQDLFKFLQAFVRGGMSNFTELLEAGTISEMVTPQIPNLDPEVGLHLFLLNADNMLWGHDGGEQGVQTIMAFNPDTKVGAIILTNRTDADLDEIIVNAYQLGTNL